MFGEEPGFFGWLEVGGHDCQDEGLPSLRLRRTENATGLIFQDKIMIVFYSEPTYYLHYAR